MKDGFVRVHDGLKEHGMVEKKTVVIKYIEDGLFPQRTYYKNKKNDEWYIVQDILDEYVYIIEHPIEIKKVITDRVKYLLNSGYDYKKICNGLIDKSTLSQYINDPREDRPLKFRTISKLCSREAGFGKSMRWLVYKAKQLDLNKGLSEDRPSLATLGKAMNDAFIEAVEKRPVKSITGPITEPETETPDNSLKKLKTIGEAINAGFKEGFESSDETPDIESQNGDVWDTLLVLQEDVSELKSRIEDLESENVGLKYQIKNLKETKKDKWRVRHERKKNI